MVAKLADYLDMMVEKLVEMTADKKAGEMVVVSVDSMVGDSAVLLVVSMAVSKVDWKADWTESKKP
jgi:hypothetical protein